MRRSRSSKRTASKERLLVLGGDCTPATSSLPISPITRPAVVFAPRTWHPPSSGGRRTTHYPRYNLDLCILRALREAAPPSPHHHDMEHVTAEKNDRVSSAINPGRLRRLASRRSSISNRTVQLPIELTRLVAACTDAPQDFDPRQSAL